MVANERVIATRLDSSLPKVCVVVLNFNGRDFIPLCLDSILKSHYSSFDVHFVDNASRDDSVEVARKLASKDRRVIVMELKVNEGYARANNLGASQCDGKYIAFLNVDTAVSPEWMSALVTVMQADSNCAASQGKILLTDRPRLLDNAGHFIDKIGTTFVIGHQQDDSGPYDQPREIFAASGAAIMVRSDAFRKVGGFDDDFFLLFEETDLCWRFWLSGFKVLYNPIAKVWHKVGFATRKLGAAQHFFLRRNKLAALEKNYCARNVVAFVPLCVLSFFAIGLLVKDKRDYFHGLLKALVWNAINLRRVYLKRLMTQSSRKIPDGMLVERGLIWDFNLVTSIRNGF